MCVVSMVMDYYRPRFNEWWPQNPPTQPVAPVVPTQEDAARLAELIAAFKRATEAAKQVDRLTAQPDCEDPEKAKLVERVAVLEKELAALKMARRGRRGKRT